VIRYLKGSVLTAAFAGGLVASADAADIIVNSNITTSTVWTASNTYNLQGQIYVTNGATLTIEAGTIVASTTNGGGSLAVTRGSQIFVNGTANAPVVMTSKADQATWASPTDPTSGTWRQGANEWGNLTLMGEAYISEDALLSNTATPSPSNEADMEGLTAGPSTDRYGGGNDDDDSGTINYLSIRYGGKVVGLNNELNGLSLGGIGRGTDIDYVEIMNNVDDGIETWGGTVNIKHFSIWNVGDDSFDVDQGWRGSAQFGLIVQGYSLDASQGSGVGDNCFETDGAEDSDWQPVTTTTIYNCTVIGQPVAGDHGTAWRDNARVQYRNCIFMDLGEQLVKFDNVDGDGGSGYGFNGTLSWPATWTTPYTATSTVNAPGNPAAFYMTQTSGNLAEIKDSVFFRNFDASAYTEATARGVFDAANNNVLIPGTDPLAGPVKSVCRGAAVVKGTKVMLPVTFLDPRPANEATTSVAAAATGAPTNFEAAMYRGAFAPGTATTWLSGWTASWAFGFTPDVTTSAVSYCTAGTSASGCKALTFASGVPSATAASGFELYACGVEGNKDGLFFVGTNGRQANSWGNGTSYQCVVPPVKRAGLLTGTGTNGACDGFFSQDMTAHWTTKPAQNPGAGTVAQAQFWYRDPTNTSNQTTSLSNAIEFTVAP